LIQESREKEVNCLRPTSRCTYSSYINNYCKRSQEIPSFGDPLPISDLKMRAFITYLSSHAEHEATLNTLKLYIASFSYYFSSNKHTDLTKDPQFHRFIQSLRLEKTEDPPNRKPPITPQILTSLAEMMQSTNVDHVRYMCAISLMYYGFLRFSELRNLRYCDIQEKETGLQLTIILSKTDPTGRGLVCFITASGKPYCAVTWYLRLKGLAIHSSVDCLFPFTNSVFNERFKLLLELVHVPNASLYSAHSLRRGGAQEAAKQGIEDNVIQRHGRWKSTIFMIYTILERNTAGEMITSKI
jgi:integrase